MCSLTGSLADPGMAEWLRSPAVMNANTDAATGTHTAIGSAGSPLPLPLAVGLVVNPRSGTDV